MTANFKTGELEHSASDKDSLFDEALTQQIIKKNTKKNIDSNSNISNAHNHQDLL